MYPEGKNQKSHIHSLNWNILIILDACRYDYFTKYYSRYLEGDLKKVITPATHTSPWRKKVFGGRKWNDIVYVSANPFINSRVEVNGFDARKCFYKVIDVWDWGWSEELGTVHPGEVNKAAKRTIWKYPHKKIIIHYLQPHAPYLSLRNWGGEPLKNMISKKQDKLNVLAHSFDRAKAWIRWKMVNLFGMEKVSKMRKLLGLPPLCAIDAALRNVGPEGVRRAYEQNLKIVLEEVARLIASLSGKKIVITSDHGELLGEKGDWEHRSGLDHSALIEVPWFTLRGVSLSFKDLPAIGETREKERIFIRIEKIRKSRQV